MGNETSSFSDLLALGHIDDNLLEELIGCDEETLQVLDMYDTEEDTELDSNILESRALQWKRSRLQWSAHAAESIHDNTFHRKYRMSFHAFIKLVETLADDIKRDIRKSRYGYVPPETIVGCGLRYLAGEKYTGLVDTFGISSAEVYHCRNDFLSAVLRCEALQIKLPSSHAEWKKVARGFDDVASTDIHRQRCCGAIDGFFQSTKQPGIIEADGNPMAYFSGHYKSPGMNCQAACDARLKFLYFAVAAPGKVHDSTSFGLCPGLKEAIENLPFGMYFVGDAAYDLTDRYSSHT